MLDTTRYDCYSTYGTEQETRGTVHHYFGGYCITFHAVRHRSASREGKAVDVPILLYVKDLRLSDRAAKKVYTSRRGPRRDTDAMRAADLVRAFACGLFVLRLRSSPMDLQIADGGWAPYRSGDVYVHGE